MDLTAFFAWTSFLFIVGGLYLAAWIVAFHYGPTPPRLPLGQMCRQHRFPLLQQWISFLLCAPFTAAVHLCRPGSDLRAWFRLSDVLSDPDSDSDSNRDVVGGDGSLSGTGSESGVGAGVGNPNV